MFNKALFQPKECPEASRSRLKSSISCFALNRFRRGEEGTSTFLTLFIFICMLLMAGLGVDTMRHEMERTHLQSTLDAAVLAGAGSPTQKTDEEIRAIVEDYFAKSDMSQYLNTIADEDIHSTFNSTWVTASADMTIDTYLMKLSGVDTLDAAAAATAEITIPKLEISLVLDVSGSMRGTKLTAVQSAAKEFVTTILNSADPGDAVISVVPFSWNVTPNQSIYNALSVDINHDYSTCLRFDDSDFDSVSIDPNTTFDQQIYTTGSSRDGYDFDEVAEGAFSDTGSAKYNRSCYDDEEFRILPYSISETQLHDKIDELEAAGSTSGHLGMKWGAALLDPAFEPVLATMQVPETVPNGDGTTSLVHEVDPSLSNIPAQYSDLDTQKVIVMMGDGVNDVSFLFNDTSNYRGSGSDLYRVVTPDTVFDYGFVYHTPSYRYYQSWAEGYCHNWWFECVYTSSGTDNETYYLRNPNTGNYYETEEGDWISATEFNNIVDPIKAYGDPDNDDFYYGGTYDASSGLYEYEYEQLTWEEAWGLMSPRYYAERTGIWSAYNEYRGSPVSTSTKDARMKKICDAVKAKQNVVIYTIGFEVPANGHAESELRKCSSGFDPMTGSNYYFPSDKANISETFAAIASNVQNLRLTQ